MALPAGTAGRACRVTKTRDGAASMTRRNDTSQRLARHVRGRLGALRSDNARGHRGGGGDRQRAQRVRKPEREREQCERAALVHGGERNRHVQHQRGNAETDLKACASWIWHLQFCIMNISTILKPTWKEDNMLRQTCHANQGLGCEHCLHGQHCTTRHKVETDASGGGKHGLLKSKREKLIEAQA